MAAKKDKSGIDAVRADIQSLSEAFWSLREAMLADAAVSQSESRMSAADGTVSVWTEPGSPEVDASAALLAALGQPQRLRIAMMLVKSPTAVTTMVEHLGLKTTGAAYHHVNVLMNAGIAIQPERGTYAIAPDAVAPVSAILAALFGAPEDVVPAKKKKKA